MKPYKPKAKPVHATQITANDNHTLAGIINLCMGHCTWGPPGSLFVTTKSGAIVKAAVSDYIVRHTPDDYRVMSEMDFESHYEPD